jgi:hypothetical protein
MTEPRFGEALDDLRPLLEGLAIPFVLIGGLAAVARGVDRLTRDIDVEAWAADRDPEDPDRVAAVERALAGADADS